MICLRYLMFSRKNNKVYKYLYFLSLNYDIHTQYFIIYYNKSKTDHKWQILTQLKK